MKKGFKWLCLICFCIVLAASALGIFEDHYFRDQNAKLFGCYPGPFGGVECPSDKQDVAHIVAAVLFSLPIGFIIAPLILLDAVNRPEALAPLTHAFVGFLTVLNVILVLAALHVVRMMIWLIKKIIALPTRAPSP